MEAAVVKVLLVAINYEPEPTGIAPYAAGLARGLVADGHQVHVLTGVPHYPKWRNYTGFYGLTRHEIIDGVRVTRLRHFIPRGGIGWRRALMEITFGVRVVTSRWDAPDLVLTVSPPLISSGMAMLKAQALPGRPCTVLWSQDLYSRGLAELDVGKPELAELITFLEGCIYRSADHVIAIGENFRNVINADLHVPCERMAVHQNWSHIAPAVEGSDRQQSRELGWVGRRVVLHAGNIGKKQGLGVVVEAAWRAQAEDLDLYFVLMGDGSERPALERAAVGCRTIQFIDPLPDHDFRGALAAADVLLLTELPSVGEMAVPSKLTTYFKAGRPVVAAVGTHGNAARLVAAAGAGRIVPPGCASKLLIGCLDLLADAEAARRCGESAQRYAQAHLQSATAVKALIRHLEDLASQGQTPIAPANVSAAAASLAV